MRKVLVLRAVEIGSLEEDCKSKYASPKFAIAKKNGTIGAVSDMTVNASES
jgi:hypothetical protein